MEDRIPKTLDNPWRALGIPIDSWVIFIAVWSLFVLFDKGLYGIFAGILAASVFTRFRKRSIIRKAMRFMYWYFPSEMNTIPGVQGHIRKLQLTLDGTSKLK